MKLRLLITAGPTREPIDPVRFISNASTGKQGAALAAEAVARGWVVDMVHGPLEVAPPEGATCHPVLTAAEMLDVARRLHASSDAVVAAAAVSDYRPAEVLPGKRRREGRQWSLVLVPTEDIIADLGRRKEGRIHVGFALDTDPAPEDLLRKLREKHLDFLVANPASAIGADASDYLFVFPPGEIRALQRLTKRELAHEICEEIERLARYRKRGR